jgi:hypothetical protein
MPASAYSSCRVRAFALHLDRDRRGQAGDVRRGEEHAAEELASLRRSLRSNRAEVPDDRPLRIEVGGDDEERRPLRCFSARSARSCGVTWRLDQALQRARNRRGCRPWPELEDVGRCDPSIKPARGTDRSAGRGRRRGDQARVETPVTTAKSGRVPAAVQPSRMPALNAPFSPPPESTSQGPPETFAKQGRHRIRRASRRSAPPGCRPMRTVAPS